MNWPNTTRASIEALRYLCRAHHDAVVPFGGDGTVTCLCGAEKGGMAIPCVGLDDLLKIAEAAQWHPIKRFPDTITELEEWGYRIPKTGEEIEAEQPMQFPDYPPLGEIQTISQGKYRAILAQSEVVETLSRDGFAISARWTWRKFSTNAYSWHVAPSNMNVCRIEDVDFWRSLIIPGAAS